MPQCAHLKKSTKALTRTGLTQKGEKEKRLCAGTGSSADDRTPQQMTADVVGSSTKHEGVVEFYSTCIKDATAGRCDVTSGKLQSY